MTKDYMLEPNKFYQYSDFISSGNYDIAYYYGIDPFYHQKVNVKSFREHINTLLFLVDIIIFSPNTIFFNFKEKSYFDSFDSFWKNNTITTAIWTKYNGYIDEFLENQLEYKSKVITPNKKEIFNLFNYNGIKKTVFLRNQSTQSIRYYNNFLNFFNTIFTKNNRWKDENTTNFIKQVEFYTNKDKEQYGVTFSYERLMKLLVSNTIKNSYSNEFVNEVSIMSAYIYFIVGSYTNNAYSFPEIPSKYLRLINGIKINYLKPEILKLLLLSYGITWDDFCKLSQIDLLYIRKRDELIIFRKLFKKLVQSTISFENNDLLNKIASFFDKSKYKTNIDLLNPRDKFLYFLSHANSLIYKFLDEQFIYKDAILTIQLISKKSYISGREIYLSKTLFDMLLFVLKNKHRVLSSVEIAYELSCHDSTIRGYIATIKNIFRDIIQIETTSKGYIIVILGNVDILAS
ncbi:MAG: HTH domain-containing protein [Cyanobacteriota bacterium]|mgnify:CR=1 FL=1